MILRYAIAWLPFIIIGTVLVFKGYKFISSIRLKLAINSLGENLTNEKVENFIKLVKRTSITNHPTEWNRLRAGFQMVNQSPNISSDLKRQLMNVLMSKGLNLGNIRILENEEERKNHKEQKIRESGEEGEREVQYSLKWLPSDTYKVLHNVRIPHHIERQEFDHIVLSPYAIFHLETKSHGGESGGKITISKDGDWSLTHVENTYGIENPLQQVNRHDRVLKDYIAKEFPDIKIPVEGVVVIANKKTTIEGLENTPLVVQKVDRLNHYIENYNKEMRADDISIELLYNQLSKFTAQNEKAV
ncbi:hypothetical protein HNQ80_001188 [Anaerosolibacter carboniphilus]|uniref:NERD domain-containing protein n=1 Tax=Anaerosolibacter carboniphilus TaxID=1417629 RepID=A0A841KY72_9FIRM|nr:nuclease-related domain-containing protein [Anaerosolibacter carboniphilus]MBB6215099.1 hypothetical protein [Anaerosolibacter carboniphilus]